ncbi:Response regulator receiver domain-containing protein [Enterovibrio nigricans DSM 22720]|uniref:Response regulator receiver domain-containing protein n=2 Tax=Enterovibrio nigricans TaxID=504469 RepID=A0A1T4W6G8_9GAMM|nr:Response regulator receiver domain-containing protein [Enterovibrio nigricans DSM 22720]
MPNMNGIDATKEIRKVNPFVPIVCLTGEYSPEIISEVEEVTDDHLEKPITKKQLVNMATKWCVQAKRQKGGRNVHPQNRTCSDIENNRNMA